MTSLHPVGHFAKHGERAEGGRNRLADGVATAARLPPCTLFLPLPCLSNLHTHHSYTHTPHHMAHHLQLAGGGRRRRKGTVTPGLPQIPFCFSAKDGLSLPASLPPSSILPLPSLTSGLSPWNHLLLTDGVALYILDGIFFGHFPPKLNTPQGRRWRLGRGLGGTFVYVAYM